MINGVWNMKKAVCLLFAFLWFVTSAPLRARAETPPQGLSCKAYCVVELRSGRLIADYHADDRRAVASTTKIMTALLAIESGRLNETVTVTESDVKVEGSSLGLREGDSMTLSDLVRGMMTVSGNDAAHTVARFLSGSDEAFAARMNARAADLGMTATHFNNPHGLPDDDHYSTAADMARLAVAALKYPLFLDIVSSPQNDVTYLTSARGYTVRTLKNTNQLLNRVEGCIGVKTGYTIKAGHCLVSAVERDGAGVVCVVLGSPDYWNDSAALLEYGMTEVCRAEPITEQIGYDLCVVGGVKEHVRVCNATFPSLSMRRADYEALQTTVSLPRFVYAPVRAGDRIGEISFSVDGETLVSVPLVATADVPLRETQTEPTEPLLSILYRNLIWLFR